MSQNRLTGPPAINPALIRQVLEHSDSHKHEATAVRFGVSLASVTRWRTRRAREAAHGRLWPSDADLEYWRSRQAVRRRDRAKLQRWQLRRAQAGGPLFVDATGTSRRLQALTALGYRYIDVAAELGVAKQRVEALANRRFPVVHVDTVTAVAAAYDRLSLGQGPSPRCRALARNRGWQLPEAWDGNSIDDPSAPPATGPRADDVDEVAVERVMAGATDIELNRAERRLAITLLHRRGRSDAEIAALLRSTKDAVFKARSRLHARPGTSTDVAAA